METNVIRQKLLSYSMALESFLGYSKKKGNLDAFWQLAKFNIFDGNWDELRSSHKISCDLYDELREGCQNWNDLFHKIEVEIPELRISEDKTIEQFTELCYQMYTYVISKREGIFENELNLNGSINTDHPNYDKFKIFEILNNGFGNEKATNYLMTLKPKLQRFFEGSNLNINIRAWGNGGELIQGFITKNQFKEFKSSNVKDWSLFCTEILDLEGYWDIDKSKGCTGLFSDNCNLEITINEVTYFKGNLWDFQNIISESWGIDPYKNVTEKYLYTNSFDDLPPEFLKNNVFACANTSETFEVEQNITINGIFDITKLFFLIASTDESADGKDFGDYILGLEYNDEWYEYEYPGGSGILNPVHFIEQ